MTVDREGLREALAEDMLRHEYPSAAESLVPLADQPASVRDHWLGKADFALDASLAPILAQADTAAQAVAENDRLRASIANSGSPCAYCNLPREDWSKCASGFPGCARADDAMLCPHVGAELETADKLEIAQAEVARLSAEVERLRAERDEAQAHLAPFSVMAGEIAHHSPGYDHDDFFFSMGGFDVSLKPFRAARAFRLRTALTRTADQPPPAAAQEGMTP